MNTPREQWGSHYGFVLATIGAASYALFATSLRRFLASARAQKAYSLFGGSLLCLAGVWALSARRVVFAS